MCFNGGEKYWMEMKMLGYKEMKMLVTGSIGKK